MSPRVTAIIVVHDGAREAAHLRASLEALAHQTHRPDHIIAVAMGSPQSALDALAGSVVNQVVALREPVSFGAAVNAGLRARREDPSVDPAAEAYWLLAQDTAPEPEALAALLGALEISPSVAMVGPKLVDWDATDTIVSYGESVTPFGATVALVENELDQGQHDTVSDVLSVAAPAVLVRRAAWEQAHGMDPALVRADDGLDLGIRLRLAGHRVSVEPNARVAWAGDGIAGPERSRRGAAVRRQAGAARFAQLHRRLVYARTAVLWLHWLSLVPLALVRAVWRLISKQPEVIAPETGAAFRAAFGFGRVGRARATLRGARTASWSDLSELRIPTAEVRRRNRLRREAGAVRYAVGRSDLNFISGGGGWLVLAAALCSAILFMRILGSPAISGGALLPLSSTVSELWSHAAYGWHEIGLGFAGAADPFALVLAVLGSVTFWNPSLALVLVYVLSLPIAALGGWFAATRLTERSGYRVLAGVLWALAPMLLGSLAAGEITAVIVHLTLPWLFYTVAVIRRSWAATAVASMLLAVVVASAPILAAPLAVGWLILLVTNPRMLPRVIWLIVPTLTVFAPLVFKQGIQSGNWWALLADPGVAAAGAPATAGWRIALGIPSYTSSPWPALIESVGIGGIAAEWLLPLLLAPLALAAFVALFLPGTLRAALLLLIGALGLATAVAGGQILVTLSGADAVGIWPGAAMSLYWLGLIGAGIVGFDAAGGRGRLPALAVALTAAIVAAPLAIAFPAGQTPIVGGDGRTLPAYVAASAQSDPGTATLMIRPEGTDTISATVIRGAGLSLDTRSTTANTRTVETEQDRRVSAVAGNLISASGEDLAAELSALGVRFVLLAPPASTLSEEDRFGAEAVQARASAQLDGEAGLAAVGVTDQGLLWRYDGETVAHVSPGNGWATPLVAFGTGLVFLVALLLSVPTSNSRRTAEATPRTIGAETLAPRGRRAAPRRGRGARGDAGPDAPVSAHTHAGAEGAPPRESRSARKARAKAERVALAQAEAELESAVQARAEGTETLEEAPPVAEGSAVEFTPPIATRSETAPVIPEPPLSAEPAPGEAPPAVEPPPASDPPGADTITADETPDSPRKDTP